MRVWAVNGMKSARVGQLAAADAVLLLGQHDDRPALGRLVGQRRELRGVGQLASLDARQRAGTRWPGGCRA